MPAKPSPLLVDDELYLVSRWRVDRCATTRPAASSIGASALGGNFSASPIFADGRIYACDEDGRTIVFAPDAKEYKELAVNQLDGRFMASPAVAGTALFLRTDTHLYRVEN